MKRLISAILCMLLLITAASFTGCGKNDTPETLKLGLGVYTDVSDATDADGDTNGKGSAAITAAVVTVDADGKIVSCVLDTAEIEVAYTSEGKAIANTSFATKGELGDAYGMKAYGNATKEWFEQRDAFQAVVKGKTLDQVKALVAEGNKGTDEVTNAGCTMKINEFVLAIEKAYNNAAASDATAENTYMKLYVDEILAYDGLAHWALGANISHAEINHISAGKTHNSCYDDIFFTRTDKAYIAD